MHVAAIQLAVEDKCSCQERLNKVSQILKEILESGKKPDLIMLPEIWGCGFFDFDGYQYHAENLKGITYNLLSEWAKRLNCCILGGSIIEKDGDSLYNTSLFISSDGELVGSYRKIHLFGFESKEQQLLKRGERPVVLDTELGRIGLTTCYDLRFPEQFRVMTDMGAEILLVASAWPEARLEHWRLFNQVRALENQCWLFSCNCAGTQNGNRYAGHSMAVNPAGEIIAEAGRSHGVLWSTADISMVEKTRKTFPALADRVNIL